MKHRLIFEVVLFIFSICVVSSAGVGISDVLTSQHQDWEFIQSVGGMKVLDPTQEENSSWFLPVLCNVSGTKKITSQPTQMNSGVAVCEVKLEREGNFLQIYIMTCLVSKKYNSAETRGVNLGKLKEGIYKVQYLNPDKTVVSLREIKIL